MNGTVRNCYEERRAGESGAELLQRWLGQKPYLSELFSGSRSQVVLSIDQTAKGARKNP